MDARFERNWLEDLRGESRAEALGDLFTFLNAGLRSYFGSGGPMRLADIEDMAQESMLKALAHLEKFRGESKFTTWAMKIAVNHTLSEMRRRKWKDVSLDGLIGERGEIEFVPVDGDGTPPPEKMQQKEAALRMLAGLMRDALTEKQRTAMGAMLNGMPLAEIARRTKSNRNAVYKLIHDARRKLKSALEDAGWTYGELQAVFRAER